MYFTYGVLRFPDNDLRTPALLAEDERPLTIDSVSMRGER